VAAELVAAAPVARSARARGWLGDNWLTLAMALLAALPVLVATAHELVAGWTPTGDHAVIATRSTRPRRQRSARPPTARVRSSTGCSRSPRGSHR
jgi:hypothetical protein